MSDMIVAMGGTPRVLKNAIGSPIFGAGELFHELGTARMGIDARNSVLTKSGHTWDVRNLYIADGASFASHADKNPTNTIMALSWRASDHLADSFIRKEI